MMKKKRILFAEDDPSVLKVTKARLEAEGYEVLPATDGAEALKLAGTGGTIDLILLDIKMPKMDGFQVCNRLKVNPQTAKIPIIIFTASETHWKMLADKCIELGLEDWILKPFQTKVLLEKIRRAFGVKGMAAA